MKQTAKFLVVGAIVASSALLVSTSWAAGYGGRGGGSYGGSSGTYYGGGYHNGNYYGGGYYHGGYYGSGYYGSRYCGGGYCGGYHNCNYGWGGWWPWGLSFTYNYSPAPAYYDYSPPVYYSPPVVYSSQPAVVYSAGSTQTYNSTPPPPVQQGSHLIGVADVKALTKAGLSEDVIVSQIRNSHTVYQLSTAEIIDMKESGVSEKVIYFMINTPAQQGPRY